MADVPLKRGNVDPDMHIGRTPPEDEGRDEGDASTNLGTPTIDSKPPEKLGERCGPDSLSTALRRNQLC